MKLLFIYTTKEVEALIKKDIEEKLGKIEPNWECFAFKTKSQRYAYKDEWEPAVLEATYQADVS